MINIVPINDLKPHTEDNTCECGPELLIENGELILVHNSFDGRESVEDNYEVLERKHILDTIRLIRESFIGSETVYTQDSCVRFCDILKHVYPDGNILYDSDHAIFRLGYRHYDITGEVKLGRHIPLSEYGPEREKGIREPIFDIKNLKNADI